MYNKTEYFLKSSDELLKIKFYPDALSRRYYALLHLMVDKIENMVENYDRRHDKIRKHFVEIYYNRDEWGIYKQLIHGFFIARCNADYKRLQEEQYTEEDYLFWYNKISRFIGEIRDLNPKR